MQRLGAHDAQTERAAMRTTTPGLLSCFPQQLEHRNDEHGLHDFGGLDQSSRRDGTGGKGTSFGDIPCGDQYVRLPPF